MDLDALLSRPFTYQQALQAGLTSGALRALRREHVVVPLFRGIYLGTHLEPDLATRAAAVGLVLPEGAAACRRTAAFLHGVDLRMPGEPPLPVEIVVPPGVARPRRDGCVAYESALTDDEIVAIGGTRVTAPRRTAVDLARFRPRTEAVVALDALTHARLCTLAEVREAIPVLRGQRGVRQAAEVVDLASDRSESPMETRLRLVLVDGGLPAPEVQWEVLDRYGIVIARLDLAYPEKLIGIEYDGWRDHVRWANFNHDRDRQNAVLDLDDWRLRRYVGQHVLRTPSVIVRQIGRLLAA